MSTNSLFNLYRDLIEDLFAQVELYSEKELTLFTPGIGKEYNNNLMIVGRAVNGWTINFDKNNIREKDTIIEQVSNALVTDDLQWVIDRWGNGEYDEKNKTDYNTKKSAFWRLSKHLSEEIIGNNNSVFNKIIWTNLYKVSKSAGGNPSERLADLQLERCNQILRNEIRIYNPKIIIFLTGWSWAKDFLNGIENVRVNTNTDFVEFAGKLDSSLIIVGKHPQGKPELEHFNEIINEIKSHDLIIGKN